MKRTAGMMVWVCALAAAGACVGNGDEGVAPGGELPDEVVWRHTAYERADLAGDDGVGRLPPPPAGIRGGAGGELAARPRAELAEALRMTILHPNGGAYVAREPNWAAADAVLDPSGPVDRTSRASTDRAEETLRRAAAVGAGAVGTGALAADGPPAGTSQLVIGGDERVLSPTGLAPFQAIAKVDVFTSPTGGSFRISCTGAYIGPWTFVLAGHCLRFTDGSFARRLVIQPARFGGSLPFGQFDCRNGDASTSNDFFAAVPAGYNGTPAEHSLDFAVIDTFPCHRAPRAFLGYTVNSGTTAYSMHGYPIGRCPGAPAEGTFMCGMTGSAYVNQWRLETHLIDATAGQDGAPWWTTNATRVAGVHIGYRQYHDFGRCGFDVCRRNYARRIDGAMDTFIRAIAFDF